MNRTELEQKLDGANVSAYAYGLDGECQDETYCLERVADSWHVYYAERGLRTGERVFPSEDKAYAYLHDLVVRDPTTRRDIPGWPDHQPPSSGDE
jgi:hypothetical protein